jgi:hypothetical protein
MAVTKHGSDLVALCINGKCPGPQIIECIDGETGRVAILATCGASSGILEFNVGEVEEDEDETWFAKDDRSDIFRRQIDQAELRSKQRQITDWGKE